MGIIIPKVNFWGLSEPHEVLKVKDNKPIVLYNVTGIKRSGLKVKYKL